MFYKHLPKAIPDSLCEELLDFARSQDFEAASVNHYGEAKRMESVRNNDRLELDNPSLAARLGGALKVALGGDFPVMPDGQPFCEVGSHFRFYRYRPGQYFKPHRDGSYEKAEQESLITALFYLSDADGGDTVLMPHGYAQTWSHQTFAPRVGDALVFEHRIWHEGKSVNSGEKFVLRTDLFYRKQDHHIGPYVPKHT